MTPPVMPPAPYLAPALQFPRFTKAWAIVDLVFSCIRVPMVLFGLVGVGMMAQSDPLRSSAFFEIASGVGICIFGLTANIMLLHRLRGAIPFAYLNMVAMVFSIIVGIWQSIVICNVQAVGQGERAGSIAGALFAIFARIVILGFYFVAVQKAKVFFDGEATMLHHQPPGPAI